MKLAGYAAPSSLTEAIDLLANDADASPLAGGSTLLVEPARREIGNRRLVDLRRIGELSGIEARDGGLRIGAMTTLAQLAEHVAIREQCPALAEAARLVGDAQVRNRATVGGNLADSDPGTDLPAVVLALGAQIAVRGSGGERTLAADDLAGKAFGASLARGELITGLTVPAPATRSGSAYEKFKHPATLYALCGVAASVALADDGTIGDCRLAVTGATEAPTRLTSVEAALRGKRADDAALAEATAGAAEGGSFRGDQFGSAEYRRHLTGVLARRAVARAVERATGTGSA